MDKMTIKEFKNQSNIEVIQELMKINNGYITSKQLTELGIHIMYLNIMVDKGMIEKLDNGMDNYDIGKIYEIFGSDYTIKISPINSNIYRNISTLINFTNCENILRSVNKINPSSTLIIYQIDFIF